MVVTSDQKKAMECINDLFILIGKQLNDKIVMTWTKHLAKKGYTLADIALMCAMATDSPNLPNPMSFSVNDLEAYSPKSAIYKAKRHWANIMQHVGNTASHVIYDTQDTIVNECIKQMGGINSFRGCEDRYTQQAKQKEFEQKFVELYNTYTRARPTGNVQISNNGYKRHLDNSIDISIRMDEVQARYDKLHAEIHGYEYVPRKTLNDEMPKYEGKEKELFESMQSFFGKNKF